MIKCNRCGYEYDPRHPDRRIILMKCKDGRNVIGCWKCIEDLGRAGTEEEKNRILEEMTDKRTVKQ